MDLTGTTLGQYHIDEAIGHGGMAVVYKAQQPALDRFVAIKVLLPQQADTPEFRARFTREAKAVAQLNHPNILPIIDYGQSHDVNYIVMKYVAGGTLADRLKHPIGLATSARLITQIAAALDHAHQRGILHRDVKPSNVLLDEGEWVQLADFGLAKLLIGEQDLTTSGLSMGTPAYLSPEQGQGLPCDQHADIYSLGVVAFEMIVGRLPFTAETPMGVIIKHIYNQPPSPRELNPRLSETIEAVLLKGLAKPIEQRYHSAGEFAAALQQAISASPTLTLPPAVGLDSKPTPRLTPSTPVAVSNRILFEETVPTVPHFIGRTAELAAYQAQLEHDRFLIITGLAGMGKTTLGAKLAREVCVSPEHVFWFTFDPIEKSTTEALYWALASFLDNRGEPSLARYLRGEVGAQKPLERMAKLNLLIAALSTGDYVLCFDDVQIAQDVPDIAYFFKLIRQRFVELKQPLPATFILMGRAVPPELEYLVAQALRGLTPAETAQFLADRNVALPPELIQQLWRHTEGNPKLLELSASNLAGLSAEAADTFIASLVRRGDIRDYLMRNIHATLTPDEQLVMSALAVFPGPIARDGVEELLAEEPISRVAQHLDALVNKHVLNLDQADQIDCHDLVREYCYHLLSRRDRDRFHQRAAIYFEQEQNWLAAGYHHFERRDYALALSMLTGHADTIINAGQVGTLSDQLARFNVVTLTSDQRVSLYQTQGMCYRIRGAYAQAHSALQAALDEARTDELRADLLQALGLNSINAGDYAPAADYFQRSLQSYEAVGNQAGQATAHRYIGSNHVRLGQFAAAAQHYTSSEAIAQQLGDRRLLADANVGLGLVLWQQGRLDEAQTRLEDSRRSYREFHDRFGEANALDNLAAIYGEQGDLPRRIAYHQQALQIDQETGNIYGQSLTLNNLAHAYCSSGDYAAAQRTYDQLVQLSSATHHTALLCMAHAGLADVALGRQQPQAALEQAQQAEQYAQHSGAALNRGVAARVLGDVWLALSDPQRALTYYEQCLPLLTETGETDEVRRAQAGLQQARRLLSN